MPNRPFTASTAALAGAALIALLAASAMLTSREAASGSALRADDVAAQAFASGWPGTGDAGTSVPPASSVDFPEPVVPAAPTY